MIFSVKHNFKDDVWEIPFPLHCPFRHVDVQGGVTVTACMFDKTLNTECPDYEHRPEGCKLIEGIKLRIKS